MLQWQKHVEPCGTTTAGGWLLTLAAADCFRLGLAAGCSCSTASSPPNWPQPDMPKSSSSSSRLDWPAAAAASLPPSEVKLCNACVQNTHKLEWMQAIDPQVCEGWCAVALPTPPPPPAAIKTLSILSWRWLHKHRNQPTPLHDMHAMCMHAQLAPALPSTLIPVPVPHKQNLPQSRSHQR